MSIVHELRQASSRAGRRGAGWMVDEYSSRSRPTQTFERGLCCGLQPSDGVFFGQLLGMADNLTFTLGQNGYGAYKYVPFGSIDEVMPYLIRRAQENSEVLGGIAKETGMLRAELKRRLLSSSR